MQEKVYTIHNMWDMTIVEGIADYEGNPHIFYSLDPEDGEPGFFSDKYELKPLTPEIFSIEMHCWVYWLHWLSIYKTISVPHSIKYSEKRKVRSFNDICSEDKAISQKEWEIAEENYQNKLIINAYIQNTPSIPYQVKAKFHGTTDGTSKTKDLFIEWTDLLDKRII